MEVLKEQCGKIKDFFSRECPGVSWQYDERFNAVLITFDGQKGEGVKTVLQTIFMNCYDSSTVKKASKQEVKLAKSLSGLEKGQHLFTSGEGDITLFGAWWPWRDNSKISLRLGFFSIVKGAPDEAALFTLVKELFG